MKCHVVGVERRTGQFSPKDKPGQTINFDNFVLHAVYNDRKVSGQAVTTIKMKANEASELIAEVGGDPDKLAGHLIDFDFDRFGKVMNFEIIK